MTTLPVATNLSQHPAKDNREARLNVKEKDDGNVKKPRAVDNHKVSRNGLKEHVAAERSASAARWSD